LRNVLANSRNLEVDRYTIETHLADLMEPPLAGRCGPVWDAMRYAVLGGGQRVRPLLAMRIARALRAESHLTVRAAAAVELLHCASLIIDDLPCMDDETQRRGRPATHVAYGEAVAVLAAFGLVALAARSVVEQPCPVEDLGRLVRFQEYLLATLDCDGLIAGQAMDLGVAGERDREMIAQMKTVPLFELAARAGTLDAHPSLEPVAIDFARAYGAAFQLVDDYLDNEPVSIDDVRRGLDGAAAVLAPLPDRAGEIAGMLNYLEERAG